MPNLRIISTITLYLFLYVIPTLYILKAIYEWNYTTPCFQRIILVNSCYMIYLRFLKAQNSGFAIDFIQILIVLWIVEDFNESDTFINEYCLDSDNSYFLFASEIMFRALLWTYTISLILIILISICAIAYTIYEVLHRRRRMANRGLKPNEFDEIPIIDYKIGSSENTLCSICLNDFIEQERLIQLPGCDHLFHRECIRIWLNTHGECPYCRSNIKEQLKKKKADLIQQQQRILSNSHNNIPGLIELEPNDNGNNNQ